MSIRKNIQSIRETITKTAIACNRDPATIKLLAVSKRHSIESIQEAIVADQFLFGENYIQEAQRKKERINNADFHFIGHLQSNKAKIAAEIFSMVETIDRIKLAKSLNKHLDKLEKNLDILVQVNIGKDRNKSGIAPELTQTLLEEIQSLPHIRLKGLMTIPPISTNPEEARAHFKNLRKLSQECAGKNLFFDNNNVELSMGMSHDYTVAIEEGSTSIRVGTAIFGPRPE
jgi:pyridoxal phosphate enzyme (YggS family)